MRFHPTILILTACTACAAASASTVFNFDGDNLGTATTFTDTVNGVSATFSSSADPGGFVIYPSIYETLTGNVLGDPGPANANNLSLSIAFNGNLNAVTFDFATSDFGTASPLTLQAFEGNTLVGSATQTGQFLPGFSFPEGEIAFDGTNFNKLVVSSTATDFAIDNVAVIASAPEPSVLGLLAIGLLCAGIPAVRARSSAQQS